MTKIKEKRETRRRILSLILVFAMIFSTFESSSFRIFAEGADLDVEEEVLLTAEETEETEMAAEPEEQAQPAEEMLEAEAAAEEPPVEEPEVRYPAQTFRGETEDLFVRVHAPEGVFPEDTKMNLEPVPAEVLIDAAQENSEEQVAYAVAVDITFEDRDGDPVQPDGDVRC